MVVRFADSVIQGGFIFCWRPKQLLLLSFPTLPIGHTPCVFCVHACRSAGLAPSHSSSVGGCELCAPPRPPLRDADCPCCPSIPRARAACETPRGVSLLGRRGSRGAIIERSKYKRKED